MIDVTIRIKEEENGRVTLNVSWGDWDAGTTMEKAMAIALRGPMTETLKTLPISGKMVGYGSGDTPEEASDIASLIADITESEDEDERELDANN